MSKIARYQGNVRAFASDAQGMERTVFGGTNQADDLTSQITASFLRGWGIVGASEHPSLEDFNAAMYAMSQFIAYQHQMGVPEWHAEQEYHLGSNCTHNGESYQSLQNANVGSQPPSAKWTPVLTSKNGLANLGLERFQQAADATRIFSPDGSTYLRIDNTGWYFARKNSGKIPASIDAGGTGATNAKDAVYNLGLGAGTPAIGIPFFWPLAVMPNTVMDEWSDMVFLKPNGASFSAAVYPKLAKVWTGLVIPDMRGEFPRIWDDGRGVDAGRALLSFQGDASRNITGSFGGTTNNDTCSVLGIGAGVFANGTTLVTPTNGSVVGSATRPATMTLDISRQVPTASEFRPRNIALNFLIRAK
ncbi:hypothetical protein [Citrobacter braakii]|uniref:hypothetical protein n=1 Tax=Citrobacter braakii TaxID=57706 RepID=UPI002B241935|nr:hypothetical protein [Citrobacter braakii]MEB2437311.1 hypothetical protein [Citrobacter braakii]